MLATKAAIQAVKAKGEEYASAVKAIKKELAGQLVEFYEKAAMGAATSLFYTGGETPLLRVVALVDFGGPTPVVPSHYHNVLILTDEGQPNTNIDNWEGLVDRYVVASVPLGVPTTEELQTLFERLWREQGGFTALKALADAFPSGFTPDMTGLVGQESEGYGRKLEFWMVPRLDVQPDGTVVYLATVSGQGVAKQTTHLKTFDPTKGENVFIRPEGWLGYQLNYMVKEGPAVSLSVSPSASPS